MAIEQHPYFSFLPALPLSKTLRLGEWCIGKAPEGVPWRSARFKNLALAHYAAFAREGFNDGAMMWHHERGFDGSMPQPEVWSAIRATLCFAALDANDYFRDDPNAAHFLTTSENAALYTQPIDDEKGFITSQEGGLLKRVLSGGWSIGEETASLPDAVVAVMQPVVLSQRLSTALFAALLDTSTSVNRRIEIALEWHRFALSNASVVTWPQRLISLKTGFEALSGHSKTHLCGQILRRLFERVTAAHLDLLPWAGILWSPRERTDLARTWMQGTTLQHVVRSELEDWFQCLGDARNEIVHDGTFSSGFYQAPPERPLSRYAGPLFWTADRVLRETVKALLGAEILLCGRLADAEVVKKFSKMFEAELAQYRAQQVDPESTADNVPLDASEVEREDVETATPAPREFEDSAPNNAEASRADAMTPGDRDLSALLEALDCDAANKVRLSKVFGQPSATEEGAAENARAARGFWGAEYKGRSILITRAERDRLEVAGAEFPLPRHWTRCE